jgi:hypothetical protein
MKVSGTLSAATVRFAGSSWKYAATAGMSCEP